MSGALGSNWPKTQVKRIAAKIGSGKTPTGGSETYEAAGVLFLRSQNIHFDGIRLDDVVYISDEIDREMASTRVCVDDSLLNITGASLGRVARVTSGLPRANVNQHVCIVRPRQSFDGRYLTWSLASLHVQQQILALQVGGNRDGLNFEQVGNLDVPHPSLDEQRRIADFLDAETARIDALSATQKQAASLLDERMLATIRIMLQNGLSTDSQVSVSAIPWLERYPAHWDAVPLRYLSRIQRGASPRPIDDPIYFDDEGSHAWVRISDVTASDKYLERTEQRLSPLGRSLSVALEPGELFLSIAATVGKPIITRIHCCIHDGFVAIRNSKLDTSFLYYILLLGDALRGLGKWGTQLNLNSDTVGSIVMPVPPPAEQQLLVMQIESVLGQISDQRSLVDRQLGLLAERRQALITAAITGQIDVTPARGGVAV